MPASPSARRALLPMVLVASLAGFPAVAGATGQRDAPAASPRAEIDPTGPDGGGGGGEDTGALATGERRLQAASPGNLWAVAGAAITPIDGLWSDAQGGYVVYGVARVRLNAEMLLVQAYAALAGEHGPGLHPERIEPLVRLLTGPMYVPTLDGKVAPAPAPGHSVTIHAPGFADPVGGLKSMHPAVDAVVARALAVAYRARDVVGLSPDARALIQDRVSAVAHSPYWRAPSRLLNQINWSADVYAADATVTGDPTLLRVDYRRQLIWFTDHARQIAYPGGSPNLGSGLAFHYLPQRVTKNLTNRSDTVEYANITFGALAYLDQARAVGMGALPKRSRDLLRAWSKRIAWGDWTASGTLNWDTGKGLQRLQLTQYWLLALRGFAAGSAGSAGQGLLPAPTATARWLVRQAVSTYQRRAAAASSVVLPATAFGFTGSSLVTTDFDGLTGTARFASTLAELSDRGLASPPGSTAQLTPLPDAYAHDADIGRTAITTSRYATAFLRPWTPLQVGGLEPARLLDSRGRALTGIGGSVDGALGLRITLGTRLLVETQPGIRRPKQSTATVDPQHQNTAARLDGPLTVAGAERGDGVRVDVRHQAAKTNIRTQYVIKNARKVPLSAELRIPTYGTGPTASLKVGQQIDAAQLARLTSITAPSGGRFDLQLTGLPAGAVGTVVAVAPQKDNPTPGPELVVRFTLPKEQTTTIGRLLLVPPAS